MRVEDLLENVRLVLLCRSEYLCGTGKRGAELLYVPQLKETNDQLSALTNDAGNPHFTVHV